MMGRIIRRLLISLKGNKKYEYPEIRITMSEGASVQHLIYQMLLDEKPCMIARFGSVEMQALVDFLHPPTYNNAIRFVKGEIPSWGFAPNTKRTMHINAGFFPPTDAALKQFGRLMMSCIDLVDVLGSWRREEAMALPYMPNVMRVPLFTLEPYYFDNPWTPALEGKKILVIHPFEDTIRKQHEGGRYEHLFSDKRLTPDYELQTLKAVQSIAGNKPAEFNDWFQALEWMKSEINKRVFDIAIIGCGAYGFPLAAHVKTIGKKAVHLGGAVQYLFGIKSNAANCNIGLFPQMNEYWVKPSAIETPKGNEKVEQARYW